MKHQNFHHFGDKHLLLPLYLDEGDEIYCKACELLITQPFHGCLGCKYFLHDLCLNIPRSVLHPSHPPHPLTLLPASTYPSGSFCCNACGQSGNGFTYSCSHCEFDIHLKCARLPEKVKLIEKHQHELKLEFEIREKKANGGQGKAPSELSSLEVQGSNPEVLLENVSFECDVCGKVIPSSQWRYYCEDCDFGAHVECAEAGADAEDGKGGVVVDEIVEGKSGTALLSTQPRGEEEIGGGGTNEQLDSLRKLTAEMMQHQLAVARIQNSVNLNAAMANIMRRF